MDREEERLKNTNRDMMMVKMKSMMAIGFAFTSLLSMFNSIFDGKVVAKLPFVPISWIQVKHCRKKTDLALATNQLVASK